MQDMAERNDPERRSDEPKTMADAIGEQAKLLLLTRFRMLLVIYVLSIICSFATDCIDGWRCVLL